MSFQSRMAQVVRLFGKQVGSTQKLSPLRLTCKRLVLTIYCSVLLQICSVLFLRQLQLGVLCGACGRAGVPSQVVNQHNAKSIPQEVDRRPASV